MLLVSDVSLNELECKHTLNNSARTELISQCLRLSSETPDLMLYGWIRCSDLIIYITFFSIWKRRRIWPQFPVLFLLLSAAVAGWEGLAGAAWHRGAHRTPPSQPAFVGRRREGQEESLQFADNLPLTMSLFILMVIQALTHCPRGCEGPWLPSDTWNDSLLQAGPVPAAVSSLWLRSCTADGCGRWHWAGLEWPLDTSIFHGRKDSDWRKIHPGNGAAYPQNGRNGTHQPVGLCQADAGTQLWEAGLRAPGTNLGNWGGRDGFNFWLARLEHTPGQDEFSYG